jgi:hypothetical protein
MRAKRMLRPRTPGSPSGPPTTKLDDVRTKVRNFILNPASIATFYDNLRTAAGVDKLAPHPLTGTRFRKIITEVVRVRKIDALKRKVHTERKDVP